MNSQKKLFISLALALILPFFLACIFFIQSATFKGETIVDYDQTFTITVEDGQTVLISHAFTIPITKKGSYDFDIYWDVKDPGFNTGFVVMDKNGVAITAFTAYQYKVEGDPMPISCEEGTTAELFFLDDENAYRDFAKNYMGYEDGASLDAFINNFAPFEKPKDGDRSFNVRLAVSEISVAPVYLQFLTLALGALLLVLLWLGLSPEKEEGVDLKERLDEMGHRLSIFTVAVMLVQMVVIVILRNYFLDFTNQHDATLSLMMVILSVDLIGFPLTYLTCKGVPVTEIPKKKLGLGKFLLFVLMSYGIVFPGALIGNLVHGIVTAPVGGAQSAITTLLMTSGMFWRVLAVGIGAPIFEELVFRKLLIDRTIKYGEFIAIFFSGLAFGLFHGNFQQFFYAFGLGLLFAFVYARTGRIGYTIGLHMVVNMITSVITVFVSGKYAEYGVQSSDPEVIMAAMQASPEVALYTTLYSFWNVALTILAITGVIVLIVHLAHKRFALKRFEGEPTKGEALRALFTSKPVWVFLLGTVGLFLLSYLPLYLR
ncbi:MAG: CPBP family intramembrane metalloprotease [Lachnospiraceae bacterium]|nr:CPBP family intramembrane metalloprotease [Lachnospiraceae bacterium]